MESEDSKSEPNSTAGALHEAIKRGQMDELQELLASAPPTAVNVRDSDGITLLYSCVQRGALDCVRELLRMRAEPNALNGKPGAALSTLARAAYPGSSRCSEEVLRLLLDARADPNGCEGQSHTPLGFAASHGISVSTAILLKAKGMDPNFPSQVHHCPPPLVAAAENMAFSAPPPRCVGALGASGDEADFDRVLRQLVTCPAVDLAASDREGNTALMFLARQGRQALPLLNLLLEQMAARASTATTGDDCTSVEGSGQVGAQIAPGSEVINAFSAGKGRRPPRTALDWALLACEGGRKGDEGGLLDEDSVVGLLRSQGAIRYNELTQQTQNEPA